MFGRTKPAPAPAPAPAAPRIVIDCDGHLTDAPPPIAALVLEGWDIKGQMETAKGRLDQIAARLIEEVGPGRAVHADGIVRVPIMERVSVRVADRDGLRHILRERYPDLVEETVSAKPTPKLLEIAADGDSDLGRDVAACLTTSSSTSVSWLGGKPLPKTAR